jgi:acyl-coenzyme A thioesterase PaaI-like protein
VSAAPDPATLKLDTAALNAFLAKAFPEAETHRPEVVEAEPGRVLVRQSFASRTLRPGGLISGPAQMGEVAMAVTSSLTIHFLRGAKPGDLHAEGTLLKLGRRIATVEVLVWSESRERAAAKATVAYAIP